MSQATRERGTGRIEVDSYDPQPYDEPAVGPQLVEIHIRERFVGDIQGDGAVRFLLAIGQDGSASFVGIERVTAGSAIVTGPSCCRTRGRSRAARSAASGS
jgi:hypothetical protein